MDEEKERDFDEEKVEEHISKEEKSGLTDSLRANPWIVSTFFLGVIVLVLIIVSFGGNGMTGKTISADAVGEKLLDFYTANGAEGLTLNSTEEVSGVYQVNFGYQGSVVPIFVTRDGKYAGSLSPLVTKDSTGAEPAPTEVPKSDKPVVELYVFTYCRPGTQSEKGMIPVAKLLGDKIDFKIRQVGAMHGEYEKIEAQRQLCVEKNYPTKFLDYVLDFALNEKIGECRSDTACAKPEIEALFTKLGIDKTKIETCMAGDGVTMYEAEEANSKAKGVGGSPTLIINGVEASSGRDSASYLKTICSAFNTAPSECSQTLSSTAPSLGFGGGSSSSSSLASC